MPVEYPACTGGAGATEEEVSDLKGSQAPGTEWRGRFDGPGYFKQGRVRLRWTGAGGKDRPRSCMEEVPGFQSLFLSTGRSPSSPSEQELPKH